MRRLLVGLILGVALAASLTGTAKAALTAPTCGNDHLGGVYDGAVFINTPFHHSGPPTDWHTTFTTHCTPGKTIRIFLQTEDNAGSPWYSLATALFTARGNPPQGWVWDETTTMCSNAQFNYRVKINTDGHSDTEDWNNTNC